MNPYFVTERPPVSSGKSYLAGQPTPTEISAESQRVDSECRKNLRDIVKNGMQPVHLIFNIIKPEIAAAMNSVSDFKRDSFPVLLKTEQEMYLVKVKYSIEKLYREFFEEYQRNEHDWKLFYSKKNGQHVWAERTCAILGNLATIYRQRGSYQQCVDVMKPYKYVLAQYNAMVLERKIAGEAENDELVCCHQLTFKYHRVAVNLANCLNQTAGVAKSFRFLFQHEIDYGLADTPRAEYVWMLRTVLGRPCTTDALAHTTDAELEALAELSNAFTPDGEFASKEQYLAKNEVIGVGGKYGGSVQLAKCAACDSQEPFLSTYKQCARCKTVKYCSRDCQVAHYQQHRAACKKAAAAMEK